MWNLRLKISKKKKERRENGQRTERGVEISGDVAALLRMRIILFRIYEPFYYILVFNGN